MTTKPMPITDDVLARITLRVGHGSQPPNGKPMEETAGCVIDWASWLHRKVWADTDPSIDPVLRRFCISLNDRWDDEARQWLKPFIPRLLNTEGGKALSSRRAFMAADWAIRTVAPTWFRVAGNEELAAALESLDAITTRAQAEHAREVAGARPYRGWYSWRSAFYAAFKPKIEAELRRRGLAAADAAADAAAAAAAAAAAVAAAAADADADAVADAAADAAADADAVAAAVAAAVADADAVAAAVAAAVADADADADPPGRYWAVYNAVYAAMKERKTGKFGETIVAIQKSALDLLDRMIEAA